MQFRRSGQRDERRRKVLFEDGSAEGERAPTPTNKTTKSDAVAKAYAKAAVEETETRIADLIPTRPLGICVLFLLGLTAIAGVQALHTFVPDWSATLGDRAIAALDVTARGSLHSWLSSMFFGASAGLSLLVYIIRRHKMDDYRGRYRMWLWTAAGLVLLSINAVSGLDQCLDALVVSLAEKTLFEFVPGWSLVCFSFLGGICGLRILMDMWRSRGSSVALLAAGIGFIAVASLVVLRPIAINTMLGQMAAPLTLSLAQLTLALSLLVYARRVLLEARGLIEVKKKQPKEKKAKKSQPKEDKPKRKLFSWRSKPKDVSDSSSDEPEKVETKTANSTSNTASKRRLKIDPPHATGKTSPRTDENLSAKKSNETATASDESSGGEADKYGPAEGSPEWLELSKAQRRRIKKQRRRNAAAA